MLPANHEEVHTLVPNRGEILDFNRQVPLSRPLFDGFGSINVDSTTKPTIENKKAIAVGSASDSSTQSNVVMERLPNGWSKKAVKRLSGTSKGKKNTMLLVAFSTKKKKDFNFLVLIKDANPKHAKVL